MIWESRCRSKKAHRPGWDNLQIVGNETALTSPLPRSQYFSRTGVLAIPRSTRTAKSFSITISTMDFPMPPSRRPRSVRPLTRSPGCHLHRPPRRTGHRGPCVHSWTESHPPLYRAARNPDQAGRSPEPDRHAEHPEAALRSGYLQPGGHRGAEPGEQRAGKERAGERAGSQALHISITAWDWNSRRDSRARAAPSPWGRPASARGSRLA